MNRVFCKLGWHKPAFSLTIETHCVRCGIKGMYHVSTSVNVFGVSYPDNFGVDWIKPNNGGTYER